MGFFATIHHAINFLAPAIWLAVCLPVLARLVLRQKAPALAWRRLIVLNIVVGSLILMLGLAVLGRDGKMLTYLALVLGVASSQWYASRR